MKVRLLIWMGMVGWLAIAAIHPIIAQVQDPGDEPAGAAAAAEPLPAEAAEEAVDTEPMVEEPAVDAEERLDTSARKRVGPIRRVGNSGTLRADEETAEVVIVFGSATVEGKVRGDVVVVLGEAVVNGEVEGSLIAPMTELELGPNAHVRGELVSVGGSLKRHPDSQVDGESFTMSWEELGERIPGFKAFAGMIGGLKAWVGQGLFLGRPLPHRWGWWWWIAFGMAILYVLLAVIAPKPVAAGIVELESRPVMSFFVGILGYVLVNILFFLLAITGLGILAIPFFLLALAIIQWVGKASVYALVGGRIFGQIGGIATRPLLGLVAGLVLFTLVYMVPVLGLLAWLIVAPLGFGAALMALFSSMKSESSSPPPGSTNPYYTRPEAPEPAYAIPIPSLGPPPIIGAAASISAADTAALPRAGFWIRLAATLLDLLIVAAALGALGLARYFLIPWIAYHVAMWAWRGTTIGGVVLGLKLIRTDGQPVSVAVALVRSLAALLSGIVLFLGFFWAGWTREKLSWHDLIAGTTIVKVPRGAGLL